jgi:hypothetical protein
MGQRGGSGDNHCRLILPKSRKLLFNCRMLAGSTVNAGDHPSGALTGLWIYPGPTRSRGERSWPSDRGSTRLNALLLAGPLRRRARGEKIGCSNLMAAHFTDLISLARLLTQALA